MRFLLFTLTYPSPARPVSGTFNRSLAEALARAHEVKVVAPVPWPLALRARLRTWRAARPHSASPDAIEVLHPSYFYPPGMLRAHHGAFLWASVRRVLRALLTRFAPEVVIGYWAHPDGLVAVRAAREAGAVALVIVGGSDVRVLARNPSHRRRVLDVLRSADAVLTVGAELRDRVIELGVPGERVHALRRGVDARLFHPGDRQHSRRRLGLPGEPRILLWVGRMVPVKGLEVLIAAGARLRERGVAFQMYLVGDGPLAGRVRSWIRAAGCAHVAHLVGPVDHDRLPDWYRAADITVLSSHSEGVPNVLLESLACGTPFVATRVGGIPEIAGESSDLVPPGDADALAGALARRLSSAVPAPPPAPDGRSPDDSASALVALVRALRERRKSAAAGPVP